MVVGFGMRSFLLAGLLGLAACAAPPVSDDVYSVEREAELRGGPVTTLYPPATGGPISREELAAAGIPVEPAPFSPGASYEAGSAVAMPYGTAAADPLAPAGAGGGAAAPRVVVNNPGISDEQDFGAVAERETIESDRERLEAQRQAYRVIEPEPIEERPDDVGPNIVAYALSTTNRVGERVYSRSGFNAQNRFARNCAKYASSDLAQRDFLERGGPQRDRLGLDPDGDGFACYWDPAPFRAARAATAE